MMLVPGIVYAPAVEVVTVAGDNSREREGRGGGGGGGMVASNRSICND
jgi:hypothetical protein